ncbi:MAG TPA: hypothetical protein VJO33_19285 [Gemmatimonadaceae bacterium]|nr:hypothetical protein [Gemmatimonadaceae bacterium]
MTILPRGVGFATGKAVYEGALTLRFGQLVTAFLGEDPRARFSIEDTHVPFVVPNETPSHLELTCRIAPIPRLDGAVTFSADRAWDLWRREDGSEDIVFRGGANFGTDAWHLRFDSSFSSGTLTEAPVMPDGFIRADGYPLLEYIVARLVSRHDGALIHASTAIVDGGAFVFVGHSGAGKSTMAAIAEAAGATIPTDDRTILSVHHGVPTAWGTPWHGSLIRKSPEGAPLRCIYLLQQSATDRCEPLAPARAVKELFVRLIQPRLHATEIQETLNVLETIVHRVPTSILHFRPTRAAFEMAIDPSRSAH